MAQKMNQNDTGFHSQLVQLYNIDQNPKRTEFLNELFPFMEETGASIRRLPVMAKTVLDLFKLYEMVTIRGGLAEVINKKMWQDIIRDLKLPTSITSAAFTLRTQYLRFLYAFECHKHNFSTMEDVERAIDANRRETSKKHVPKYDSALSGAHGLDSMALAMQVWQAVILQAAAGLGQQNVNESPSHSEDAMEILEYQPEVAPPQVAPPALTSGIQMVFQAHDGDDGPQLEVKMEIDGETYIGRLDVRLPE